MKTRNLLIAAAIAVSSITSAFAAISPAKADWAKGPVSYYLSNEEKAQWKAIQTDADADAFIDLFWARRDPTPGTPRNEFREEFEARVKTADEQFAHGRVRGSMTEPGRMFILFGPPTHAARKMRQGNAEASRDQSRNNNAIGSGMSATGSADLLWSYESATAQKTFGVPKTELTFHDEFNTGDYRISAATGVKLAEAAERAAAAAVTQPNLTKAPTFQQPPAAATAQKLPAPAAVAGVKTPALEAALTEGRTGKANAHGAALSYAEFVSPTGEAYVPIGVYVPASAVAGAEGADTLFGAVEDASGTRVTTFEEPVKLSPSRTDFFVDKTLTLQPGKYTAIVGLAKAGQPVLVTNGPIEVAGTAKESIGTSRLILSDNIYELPVAQPVKSGFAFGKIKIVPKANLVFRNTDDLIYAIEMNNPSLDATTNLPKLQAKLDLTGGPDKTTISSPLTEADAAPLSGEPRPAHFLLSNTIPLGQIKPALKPGDYKLKMKVVDTISKQSYTLEQAFKITG
jgi:GWxTD domain-containing protein